MRKRLTKAEAAKAKVKTKSGEPIIVEPSESEVQAKVLSGIAKDINAVANNSKLTAGEINNKLGDVVGQIEKIVGAVNIKPPIITVQQDKEGQVQLTREIAKQNNVLSAVKREMETLNSQIAGKTDEYRFEIERDSNQNMSAVEVRPKDKLLN